MSNQLLCSAHYRVTGSGDKRLKMSDFIEKEEEQSDENEQEEEVVLKEPDDVKKDEISQNMDPITVVYCPTCTLPPEYCEYGPCFDKCLPWILKNYPQVLSDEILSEMLGEVEVTEDKPKKKNKAPKLKKSLEATVGKTQVVIAKVQRQKRKFITAVAGLDTVPGYRDYVKKCQTLPDHLLHVCCYVCRVGLKLKDAAKAFGKKFSSGASVNENATGAKEVSRCLFSF